MDRPPRRTKVVNYREPKDFDDDDDDDFACVKAPPSKKPREDVKQQQPKKPSSKSSSQETDSQSTPTQKSRRPLDEKVLERDLEAAITLSLLNNADLSPTNRDVVIHLPKDENTDPSSLHISNCSVDGAVLGLDDITSEKTSSRQKKAAANTSEEQRKKLEEEDEDYRPKLTPDSESDEDFSEADESEDEEFTVKKVSKTKVLLKKVPKTEKTKSPPATKKQKPPAKASKPKSQAAPAAAASTPVRSPPAAKAAAKRPASSCSAPAPKAAVSLSPAGGRVPKWNPPGLIGKSPTSQSSAVKSPGQGLRLGLSRLVRVKPLHPSVASH